jgi:hypothetical protein
MTGKEIVHLFERLSRLVAASKQKAGEGSAWDYTFPDGETHRYVIRGLKSHAEVEDSAFNLLIWIWNAKDYLKQRAEARGQDGKIVEDAVNCNLDLRVCADLANRLKHHKLAFSRSGLDPRFDVLSVDATQAAIGALKFGARDVEIEFEEPNLVEFSLPVLDRAGVKMGDAFQYAARGLAALEQLKARIEEGFQ